MILFTDWSEIDLCKGIQSELLSLPDGERAEVTRTYQTTVEIIRLYILRLAVPTKAARPRLEDLYRSLLNHKLIA